MPFCEAYRMVPLLPGERSAPAACFACALLLLGRVSSAGVSSLQLQLGCCESLILQHPSCCVPVETLSGKRDAVDAEFCLFCWLVAHNLASAVLLTG